MARVYKLAAPFVALGGAALLQSGALGGLLPGSEPEEGYMSSSNPWSQDYEPGTASAAQGSVHYRNCDAARAAGAAPVRYGDPGYASHLDRDGDGVGCEPYYGR